MAVNNKDFFEALLDTAKEELKDKGGLEPLLLVFTDSGITPVKLPDALMDNSELKALFLSTIKIAGIRFHINIKAGLILTEAWMKKFDKSEKVKINKPVRDYEDKQEVILLNMLTKGQESTMITVPFKRTKKGVVFSKPTEHVHSLTKDEHNLLSYLF